MAGFCLKSYIILFFLFFLLPSSILAQNLLIVEVQIAGDNPDNDYIKIYNSESQVIDISGYRLKKRSSPGSESSIRVFPEGSKILANDFFVWANSKNNYYFTINANTWSSATLAKNNSIALLNPKGEIIDAVAWGESQNPFVKGLPFPENPAQNQQLKRKTINEKYQNTDNNRQDFFLSDFKKEAAIKEPKEEVQKDSTTTPEKIQENKDNNFLEEKINYPSGIFFNEILPNTKVGERDEEKEYIEIFNQNDFEVDLSNWKITDTMGNTNNFILTKGVKIKSKGFLVFYRPETKITLNNDVDGLKLLDPNGKIVDVVNYQKAPRGRSYNKTRDGWFWSNTLTPGSENVISKTKTVEENQNNSLKESVDYSEKSLEKEVPTYIASLKESSKKEKNNFLPFIAAFTTALFSGIIILILKNKIKKDFS